MLVITLFEYHTCGIRDVMINPLTIVYMCMTTAINVWVNVRTCGNGLCVPLKRPNNIPILWRHQMETFSAVLALCVGNSPVTGEFPAQRPMTRSLHVFFDLRLNKRLTKHSWGWWFETPSRSLWRHFNEAINTDQTAWCQNSDTDTVYVLDWQLN